MASETETNEKHALIEKLKGPWTASYITPDQEQHRKDIRSAKKLWEKILEDYREQREALIAKKAVKANEKEKDKNEKKKDKNENKDDDEGDEDEGEERHAREQPFFPFFSLPPEIRNMIYDICLEDDRDERQNRSRPRNSLRQRELGYRVIFSRHVPIYNHYTKKAFERLTKGATPAQKERESANRRLLNKIVKKRLEQSEGSGQINPASRKLFEVYKLEHEMYTERCWHEEHLEDADTETTSDGNRKRSVAIINPRGNLCEDLPMLSLVNRELFQDTFFLFYSLEQEGFYIKWRIRDLDFAPFLRFYQAATKPPFHVDLTPDGIYMRMDEDNEWKDKDLHARKFSNVKRLVELHWLEGLPLWSCLTGEPEHHDCDPLGDWFYSIRQIVALYRAVPNQWKDMTIGYLCRTMTMYNSDCIGTNWAALTDAQLVEEVIQVLCTAIEYNLGYEGNFSLVAHNGMEYSEDDFAPFRYKKKYKKIASALEHAVVHVATQFRAEVDRVLREVLGDAYEEWEKLPNQQKIPQDIIL